LRQLHILIVPLGQALDDTLEAKLAIRALRRALTDRNAPASLVHHSDRGVQYCPGDYVEILRSHGVRVSMSRSGNPYDNAVAERFMRTLKCEEVYLNDYRDRMDAARHLRSFLEQVYNCRRLHATLGYTSPETYEAASMARVSEVSA
jgi:putative transposase